MSIGNLHQFCTLDRMLAERKASVSLACFDTDTAFKPLTSFIYQRYKRDWRLAYERGKLRKIVELQLRRRVEDIVALERYEAFLLVDGFGYFHKSLVL